MVFNFKKRREDILILGLVILVSVVVHWRWIFTSGVFTSGDWGFLFKDTAATLRIDYFSLWLSDSSFGRLLLDSGQAPTYAMYGFLAKYLHVDYALAERIVHLWPIIVAAPVGAFILFRRYFNSLLACSVGAFAYCFNTYFLILQTGQLTLAGAYCFVPFAIYFFVKAIETRSLKSAILAGFAISVVSAYEPRVAYITLACLFGYVVWCTLLKAIQTQIPPMTGINLSHTNKGSVLLKRATQYFIVIRNFVITTLDKGMFKTYMYAAIPVVIYGLLNAYWILGLSKTSSLTNNELFSKGLFGNAFFDISHALALFHPYWNGAEPIAFIVNPIPVLAWIVPIVAFFGLYRYRKNKLILYFGMLALVGVLLAKQVAPPFTGLYEWLYANVPGFSAFREASKFYLVICLGYSFLIAGAIQELKRLGTLRKPISAKWLSIAGATAVSFVLLSNALPLITGKVGTLFTSRHVPKEYTELNQLISNDKTFSRIYWLPTISRWGLYNSTHPRMGSIDIAQGVWGDFLSENNSSYPTLADQATGIFARPYSAALFTSGNIKYVVVPARGDASDDNFYQYYGDSPQAFIDGLSKLSWLKRISSKDQPVVIFENKQYKPSYIAASNNLLNISSTDKLSGIYNFSKNQLPDVDFNFSVRNELSEVPGIQVKDLLEDLSVKNFANGVLSMKTEDLGAKKPSTLKLNTNQPLLRYDFLNGKLNVYQTNADKIVVAGKPVIEQTPEKTLLTKDLQTGRNYFFDDGKKLIDVDTKHAKYVGDGKEKFNLYSSSSPNLVDNPSLEKGLWQKKVDDCNKYDNKGEIDMKLDYSLQADGKKSLQLLAFKHTACTGPAPVEVDSGSDYLFAFDYRAKNTRKVGYRITFNDPQSTKVEAKIDISGEGWKRLQRTVTAPTGATMATLQLLGYPDDQLQNQAITNYDNIKLRPISLENTLPIDRTPRYNSQMVNAGDTIRYEDKDYDYSNLIPNPSFEKGLWQKKVSDCNNYDNRPQLDMVLSNDASDGAHSLELDATRHVACTQQSNIKVVENSPYYFSFDYKGRSKTNAGYFITFNDPARTTISGQQSIKADKWENFSRTLKSPDGATKMSIVVYSYGPDNGDKIATKYDNFQFVRIPPIEGLYYDIGKSSDTYIAPGAVSYQSESPTKKQIQVKKARTSFYINMSETFSPSWKLLVDNSKVQGIKNLLPLSEPDAIPEMSHYKLNNFENGWFVDIDLFCRQQKLCTQNADGSFDIKLVADFTPQRWFNVGMIVSGATLVACLIYLIKTNTHSRYLTASSSDKKPKRPQP